jgi:hypothetical protein
MKIDYTVVRDPHPHTVKGQLARTFSGSFFWDKEEDLASDRAVLATRNGRLVGIQKFNVRIDKRKRVLKSVATFVWPMYRGINIAQKMWALALTSERIQVVDAQVVSDRGKTLIETLSEQFPKVKFVLYEAGSRPLRSLKGKAQKARRRAA